MFDNSVEISACIIDAFLAMWFVTSFNKCSVKNNRFFFIFVFIHTAFNVSVLFFTSFSTRVTLINGLILVVYSFFNKESTFFRKAVAPFAFEGALIIVNSSIAVILSEMLGVSIDDIFNGNGLKRLFSILTCKILLWVVLSVILKFFKDNSMKLQDYFLLILFPSTAFFEFAFFLKLALAYDVSELYIFLLTACILIIASNVGIYYLVHRIGKNSELESEKELYKQMLTLENKRYQDMTESYAQIKQIRHDIKNQLLSVGAKISDNDIDSAKENLNKILEGVDSTGMIINSGNRIIDYVVNIKLGNVKNRKILVRGDASEIGSISDLELSILLGNILDNAIEATESIDNSRIELIFTVKNNYQSIICKNTIEASVLKINPNLSTTKSADGNHGYGIKSVKDIAERYNGFVEFFQEKDMFCIQILLPLEKSNN